MAQRGGRTDVRTNGRTDERKISPFYRTSSPIGAAAQKGGKEGKDKQGKEKEKRERKKEGKRNKIKEVRTDVDRGQRSLVVCESQKVYSDDNQPQSMPHTLFPSPNQCQTRALAVSPISAANTLYFCHPYSWLDLTNSA